MNIKKYILLGATLGSLFSHDLNPVSAQGTAFTYEGRLTGGGTTANGSYDLTFTLFATNTNGVPIAGPVTNSATAVSNGSFIATVDFGSGVFTGGSNWLEIAVRTNGAGSFTTLTPRQQVTPTPYAIFSENSGIASQANGLASGTVSPLQLSTLGAPTGGQVLGFNGSSLVWINLTNSALAWNLSGNAGTTAGVNFVGTTDNQPLNLDSSGYRGLQLAYVSKLLTQGLNFYGYDDSMNLIGGFYGNVKKGAVCCE